MSPYNISDAVPAGLGKDLLTSAGGAEERVVKEQPSGRQCASRNPQVASRNKYAINTVQKMHLRYERWNK
jgi:hypothetical protein